MKKDELIEEIIKTIDECLIDAFSFFEKSEINQIMNIVDAEGFAYFAGEESNGFSIGTVRNLEKLGLIFCKKEDDKIIIHMPEHVKARIKSIEIDAHDDCYNNIRFYTNAFACVYGAIDIEDAYEIIR